MFVQTYPWLFALGGTGFFVAFLAVFFARVQFANQSIGNFALNSPTRYQYETVQSRFPPSSGSTSVTVWLQTTEPLGIRKESFVRALDAFSKLLAVQPNVASVTGLTTLDASTPLSTYISLYSNPYSTSSYPYTSKMLKPFGLTDFNQVTRVEVALSIADSSKELGKSVRAVRAALESSFFVDGTRILQRWGVAGAAAEQYDSNKDILETIPNVIAVIVVGMYVLVLLLTGSVLLPIKSIICAALSVCASFGILVLVVQEGNGSELLQFRNNFVCLDPIQLVFIFVVSFGLSLDYEVFMIGRIQEIYELTGDTKFAVAKGVQTSARAITIAAVLLCTAVGGFLSSEVLVLKQIGIGIGLTIVMDATIMRCVLVPAYIAVLPDWMNWWAPVPVKRVVAFLDFKEKS
jgi:RND superfamily putative drug exporter